jgi:hypothetical protein
MSLRPLNRDPKNMSGEYSKMFELQVHAGNKEFSLNPYNPKDNSPASIPCFSLVHGAGKGKADMEKVIVWRASGDLTSLSHKDLI